MAYFSQLSHLGGKIYIHCIILRLQFINADFKEDLFTNFYSHPEEPKIETAIPNKNRRIDGFFGPSYSNIGLLRRHIIRLHNAFCFNDLGRL